VPLGSADQSLNRGQVLAVVSTIASHVRGLAARTRSTRSTSPGYMTGANQVLPGSRGFPNGRIGDPEFVNLDAAGASSCRTTYVFFTDPTYPETHLVVTRVAKNGAFADVNLDCLGNISQWLPIGNNGKYQYAQVTLSTGDFQAQGNCNNGRHSITSNNPFGLTVWGPRTEVRGRRPW
jgi:hypothetical protein